MKGSSRRKIGIGALMSYLAIAIDVICGLIYTPWLIGKIGQSNYGLYTLAISLINLFLIDFGISAAVTRFISKCEAEGDRTKANEYTSVFATVYLTIDIFISFALIIAYFFLEQIYVSLTPKEFEVFRIIYVICACSSIIIFPFTALTNGVLNSYELFGYEKACRIVQKVLPVIIIFFLFTLGSNSIYLLVTINSFSQITAIIIKLVLIIKKTPINIKYKIGNFDLLRTLISFSVWTAITGISDQLLNNAQASILGMVSGTTMIAIYGIAAVIEGYIYTITTALNGMFLPHITRLVVNNKTEEWETLVVNVGRVLFAFCGLIFVGFLCVGKQFLYIWLDSSYDMAYYCIVIMTIPALIIRPFQAVNTTMIVRGYVKPIALIDIIVAIVDIFAAFFLAKLYGAIGSALAISFCMSFGGVIKIITFRKCLKNDLMRLFKKCYLNIGIPILICSFLAFFIKSCISVSVKGVLFGGTLITCIYMGLFFCLCLTNSEKNGIKSFLYTINSNRS